MFASGYEQKFLAVVSNRTDISAQQLLRWHWQKAGTIEHIHDVTKIASDAGELILRISAAADQLVQLARARHRLADMLSC